MHYLKRTLYRLFIAQCLEIIISATKQNLLNIVGRKMRCDAVTIHNVNEPKMSVPPCRDARCDGTPFLPDARAACNVLKNRQIQYVSIL